MVAKKKPAAKKMIAKKKPAPKQQPPVEEETEVEETAETETEVEETETEVEETEGEFKLPRGIKQEEYDAAKEIIVEGFANGADPDEIKGALFEAGVPFSKMVRLYKLVTSAERLIIPVKEVRENIQAWIEENNPDLDSLSGSYSVVDQLAKYFQNEIEGCTPRVAFDEIRKYLTDYEYPMPKKPKGMGRTSAVAKLIVNAFAENSELSFDEYKAAIEDITTEKSITRWLGLYKPFSLVAMGEPFPE